MKYCYKKPVPKNRIMINFFEELTLSQTSPCFKCLQNKCFENYVGIGKIAHYEHFLLFPVFPTLPPFSSNFANCCLQFL